MRKYIPKYLKHQIKELFFAYLPCNFCKIVYKMCSKRENIYFTQMFMLFLNISSDYVQILDGQDEQFLARNSIEHTL